MKIGYARVSSIGQNLDSQIDSLKAIGCDKIYKEKKSATQSSNRLVLKEALEYCREGDTFVVTRLDRCSRSVADLSNIVKDLSDRGVAFKATEQDLDTTSATGKLMIGVLGSIAEFETNLRAERQADGIRAALARGKKWGRKAVALSDDDIMKAIEMKKDMTSAEVAKRFGMARGTLLRKIRNYKER
jgi:DNA invertase Pin-like site-specific DNA recombinase